MEKKILQLLSRLNEVETLLGEPTVFNDAKKYRSLTQEHSYLRELKTVWDEKITAEKQLGENQEMLKAEKDPDFTQVLKEEIALLEARLPQLQVDLEKLLIPPDINDNRATILELRAGTGGDEAALFVGDCVRMYKLFADTKGWQYELLSTTP